MWGLAGAWRPPPGYLPPPLGTYPHPLGTHTLPTLGTPHLYPTTLVCTACLHRVRRAHGRWVRGKVPGRVMLRGHGGDPRVFRPNAAGE